MRESLPLEPILVNDENAASMLGIGVTMFRALIDDGTIGPTPICLKKRKLHSVRALREWERLGMPPRREWVAIVASDKKLCNGDCCGTAATCPAGQGSVGGSK